jgi:hypothetical protein
MSILACSERQAFVNLCGDYRQSFSPNIGGLSSATGVRRGENARANSIHGQKSLFGAT